MSLFREFLWHSFKISGKTGIFAMSGFITRWWNDEQGGNKVELREIRFVERFFNGHFLMNFRTKINCNH